MVTEQSPDHKRVARAEKAREEWRTKAIDRREQSEILKEKIELITHRPKREKI